MHDYATDAEVLQVLSSQVPPPALEVLRDYAMTAGENGTPAPLRRVLGEIVAQWAAMQVVSQGIATNIDKPRATVTGYSGEVDKEWDLCLSCGRAVKHFLNEAPPTASTK